ncbi:unnamed protein product [Sphagnum tenellum]
MDITCAQHLGQFQIRDVNLWTERSKLASSTGDTAENTPVIALIETMPTFKCPHPLYKRKLRIGGVGKLRYSVTVASQRHRYFWER